jgi:hypothetical protein
MKKALSALLIISILVIYSCNKDSVNTRPSLTLKSFTPEKVPINGNAEVKFTFGDKEADLDTLVIYKVRINKRTTATTRDSLKFGVPEFDKSVNGELNLALTYQNHLISATNPPSSGTPPVKEPDTLIFRFVLRDKAKNVSDTVVSSPIVITRN